MKNWFKNFVVYLLTEEAKLALRIHKPKIIAVTGNVGKTSSKDAIYSALKDSFRVRKSEKSFNSEFGAPLAVLGLSTGWANPFKWFYILIRGIFSAFSKNFPELLVLEVGADHPGDIKRITKWLHPDIAVFTKMQTIPVHVENFRTPNDVLEEKLLLAKALKQGGTVIVNGDDERFKRVTDYAKDSRTFGFLPTQDIRGENYKIEYNPHSDYPKGISFKVRAIGGSTECFVPDVIGSHHAYPVLSAVAVAETLGVAPKDAIEAMRNHESPTGRMRVLKGEKCVIIDDTYNSSPVALEEALKALADVRTNGRRIVVLGDMKELGKFSKDEHIRLGKVAGKVAEIVVTVGGMAKLLGNSAYESSFYKAKVFHFDNSMEAANSINEIVAPFDVVLVKGSQSMRMEHIVKALLAKELKASENLVRQDKEWEKR